MQLPARFEVGTARRAVPTFIRAFQWDLARQTERLDWLLAQLPRYAEWGYTELYLHLEDAVEYPSLPAVARPGAYAYGDIGRLVWAATAAGIDVVPVVNLLGHTDYLLKVPELRDLNECRSPDGSALPRGQLCPLHPRTLEIAGKLLEDVAPFCTAGKVHVGLDESYHFGRHPLSRREIDRLGLAGHFAGYVRRLEALAAGVGLRLGLWADMLALLPAAIPRLPPGIIAYDWYYYSFRRLPRIEIRNFSEYDLAARLRARGIEYWGCPMNGAFRHEPMPIFCERLENIVSWWRRCRRTGAAGMLVTSWEPSRLAAELPMTVDAAAAGLWLEGEEDPRRLLELGCRRMFGSAGPRVARALRESDRRPFSGYVRWQTNDRWDTVVSAGPHGPWKAEARAFRRLARTGGLPPAVAASVRFRAYLAERDLLVRAGGQAVWRIRRLISKGDWGAARRLSRDQERAAAEFSRMVPGAVFAARAMWRRTRDARQPAPNEGGVAIDAVRLRAWIAWLRRARTDARHARQASPVAGAWQLVFGVRHFAPAAQRLAVERLSGAGEWAELHGLFAMEFRSRAARPRAGLCWTFSAPVAWGGLPERLPRLRVVVRGFGRIRVGRPMLTNGVEDFVAAGSCSRILGVDAPKGAFPDFDWQKNRALWRLEFPRRPRETIGQSRASGHY